MFVSTQAARHPHRSCPQAACLASQPTAGEAAEQEFHGGKEGKLEGNLKTKQKQ